MTGQIFIVSAPSGAGKSSLVNALIKEEDSVCLSISHTTRLPRPGEIDGKEYFFVTRDNFNQLIQQNVFLEYAEVYGNFYGTSAHTIRDQLAQNKDVMLEIDWQGARQVKKIFPNAVSIFVLPPSLETLKHRLIGRGKDSEEVINQRLEAAKDDISHESEFDYAIINEDFNTALEDLKAIVRSQKCRRDRQYPNYMNLFVLR
ncbi:guanylate kinase [Ferrovum sp. PN-J185]|uniref:guanylate kinase n=1 Tax=Ferrovum sp. PN-J185 TaxID=1356306 RepID=UPI00079111DE|nr:guanylate kinase [Ferrovum sp. PN-J185]KXW56007.1 guanylate kinase [Ferrovum sp. PN-J185]MCC6068281.1 guanylate kinase [Ferrovum sp. PN-J185]MDE2056670.1 guanylate kinase [Betaproteobacteria bacterium]